MPAITPLAKLIALAVLAVLDIINYIWGIELIGLRNEQVVGIIVTLLLAAAGMLGVAVPTRPTPTPTPHL